MSYFQNSTAKKCGMNILIRVTWTNLVNYGWFARDVTAAMLVVKKQKSFLSFGH